MTGHLGIGSTWTSFVSTTPTSVSFFSLFVAFAFGNPPPSRMRRRAASICIDDGTDLDPFRRGLNTSKGMREIFFWNKFKKKRLWK